MSGRELDLEALQLQAGCHQSAKDGMCVMEAVSFVSGEPWSDSPQCACPVIAAFLRRWNDRLPNAARQDLKKYIPQLVGSRVGPRAERRRGYLAADWAVRISAPLWLRAAGNEDDAKTLEQLAPIVDVESARAARDVCRQVRDALYAKARVWWAAAAAADAAADADAAAAAADADADAASRRALTRAALDVARQSSTRSAHELVERMLAMH